MNRIGNGSSIYFTTQKSFLHLTKKFSISKHSNIEFLALLVKLIVIHGLSLSAMQNEKKCQQNKNIVRQRFFFIICSDILNHQKATRMTEKLR